MAGPDVSIVIVSYNTGGLLDACLASLGGACAGLTWEAIVVDNGSRDDTIAMVRERHPGVVLIEPGENLGFARATNLGLAAASGNALVWLNPDCVMRPGSLRTLAEALAAEPSPGVVGPRLLYPDGRPQPSAQAFPGLLRVVAHFLGARALVSGGMGSWTRRLVRGFGGEARDYADAHADLPKGRAVDWVSGACLATTAAVAREVGPLDERYFMYCEDADWCQRVHAAGREVRFVPEAIVEHHVGASGSSNPRVLFHYYRSLLLYFARWRPSEFGAIRAVMACAFALRTAGDALRSPFGAHDAGPWRELTRLALRPERGGAA